MSGGRDLTNGMSAVAIESQHGDQDTANATARLRLEAQEMRQERQPLFAPRSVHNITELFLDSSKRLRPGELIKDEYFTLFEAVGALEIMDDKMDSGYVPPGDTFEADFDPCQELSPQQVIWIMDELMRLEMLFHAGYPLSQNVFTSLHIFRLIDPENRSPYSFDLRRNGMSERSMLNTVLRSYCLAVLKCCELALRCIQSQIYFEEEDFVTSLFGRELCPQLTPQDALALLSEAMAWIDNANLDSTTIVQITHRLSIRESMLHCFDEPLPVTGDHWAVLRAKFDTLVQQENINADVHIAFSDKVQRQLATSTPPRPMPHLELSHALQQWIQMCDDSIIARQLTSIDYFRDPISLTKASWHFGYRQPEPMTFARAKMQESLTWEEGGDYDGGATELLLADIREKVLPGDWIAERDSFAVELPTDDRHRTSRVVLDFMSQALGDYINLYRMVCQNRSRMRRMLTQATILWDDLELRAKDFDEELNSIVRATPRIFHCGGLSFGPLSIWTKLTKLQICEWTIQVGFETDIYQPDELGIMYELLAWFTTRRRIHLEAVQFSLHVWRGAEDYEPVFRARVSSSQIWRYREILLANATQALAKALALLYKCLEVSQLIRDRQRKAYYKVEEQYEARMKPFLGMQSDIIPDAAALYVSSVGRNANLDFERLKAMLNDLTGEAKRCLDRVKAKEGETATTELKPLFVVCIAVRTTFARIEQIRKSHGIENDSKNTSLQNFAEVSIPPPGEKRHHDWWIVPEVKAKK